LGKVNAVRPKAAGTLRSKTPSVETSVTMSEFIR
jgi:hypothetical protein